MNKQPILAEEIKTALQEVAVVLPPRHTFLRARGADCLDFLHRITTNDLRKLNPREVKETVLCNEKGRILDVIGVLNEGETLLMTSMSPEPEGILSWINKFIITEDVEVRDVSSVITEYWLIGPQTESIIALALGEAPTAGLVSASLDKGMRAYGWVSKQGELAIGRLLFDSESRNERGGLPARAELLEKLPTMSRESYSVLRILSGVPAWPNEISPKYNPLEIGLLPMISFTKGCYVGQEVIARLETYRKVQHRLRGVAWNGTSNVSIGDALIIGGEEVGTITSVAAGTYSGSGIGMALIRHSEKASVVRVVCRADATHVEATIHTFPFLI